MEIWEWMLWSLLVILYIGCLVSLAVVTFQKGRYALGIIGFFFPVIWLVGALLPARPNSHWDTMAQHTREIEEITKAQ